MKRLVIRSATSLFAGASLLFLVGSSGTRLHAQAAAVAASPASADESTPVPSPKPNRKAKNSRDAKRPAATPRAKPSKEIPIPIQPGDPAKDVTIPETDAAGALLSILKATEVTRLDTERVAIKGMNMNFFHADGKQDFLVVMPTSVFNLKTRIIASEDPVTVKTQDFELTGEKMEFNTVDRTGRLIGKVRMLVHNLKQVAGQAESPKQE